MAEIQTRGVSFIVLTRLGTEGYGRQTRGVVLVVLCFFPHKMQFRTERNCFSFLGHRGVGRSSYFPVYL
jgi:hypothetical protein